MIVNTYRRSETKDKYSYVATLVEIAENDYNLNIPRYVNTFEAEEPIDINEVATNLKQFDNDLAEVNKEIAGFCNGLGTNTLF